MGSTRSIAVVIAVVLSACAAEQRDPLDSSGANSQRTKPVSEGRHERARSYQTAGIAVEG